ncbi:tripartite tricarboxylate transporter permease [Methanoregula sp.]|uniref:tripartite tricarboxylate transporter permease n=1 Tax=Methanoregula sp. TaxID=2052170 RepID=UPI00260C2D4E|nr:tripartite tricarboxylate transporter permease [Methanoregula sp.]MDD5143817.1 tripartite tricarboxylate transporter permease [Methanoregula sp.]
MIEILLGVLAGVILGTISGIIPGVHANTLAGVLVGLQVIFLSLLGPVALACALFSALITHTFVDAIPSTFLGIPDADTALAVLPAHALCLEGNGEEAVRIAALGSACAMVIAVPLSIVCFLLLPSLQPWFDWWIGILLIAAVGWMLVTSDAPLWGLAIFLVSGILGVFALRYAFLGWHTLAGSSAILMPLLCGLFGISVLLTASQGTVPEQQFRGIRIPDRMVARSSILGTAAGIAVGWLPGLSTASANGVLASIIGYDRDRRAYLLATNAANTANAFIGLAALFALERMRNGVIAALAELPLPSMGDLMVAGVLAACAAYLITVWLSRSAHRIGRLDNLLLNRVVIAFVVGLSILLTGPFGFLVLILATAVGLVPRFINLPAVYCMGSIMIPVILWSFGITWA